MTSKRLKVVHLVLVLVLSMISTSSLSSSPSSSPPSWTWTSSALSVASCSQVFPGLDVLSTLL